MAGTKDGGKKSLDKAMTQAYLLGSLHLRGSGYADMPSRARRALGWYRDVVSWSDGAPPFVLVYDLGWLLIDGHQFPFRELSKEGFGDKEAEILRAYQNFFLNALVRTDDSFRRAIEAIAEDPSRDDLVARTVGLLLRDLPPSPVRLNSAILRSIDVIGRLDPWAESERWDEWSGREGAHRDELASCVDVLVARTGRRAFGEDDLSEIEHWSAYRKQAQRVAGRRIAGVSGSIPPFDPRTIRLAAETGKETEIPDSGTWAEGGYVGVGPKGAIESLVPSELAYLGEESGIPRVDLFQLRESDNQLLYFERDQGELQRHVRTVHVAISPDAGFRVMVRGHTDQLAVGLYGVIVRLVKDLDVLFRQDALRIVIHLIPHGAASRGKVEEDAQLLSVLLRNEIAHGILEIEVEPVEFELSKLAPDPKSIVYWISFQLADDAPAGMPQGAKAAAEAAQGRVPPRVVVVRIGGGKPPARRTRHEPAVLWLPLDRDDGSFEPVPLLLVAEDARDEILRSIAGGSA